MSDHIAEHLAPERCFICGKGKHPNTAAAGGHQFFANGHARGGLRRRASPLLEAPGALSVTVVGGQR